MSPGPTAQSGTDLVRRARAFVVTMGVVALFGDMTYEGARGLVGPYLGLLGASAVAVGLAAGAGELAGYALRLVTGWLADRTRAHWLLTIVGYSFNLVVVPALALAGSWEVAVALVIGERVGKAIRSPARSTLVSYAARRAGEGASFGLEEALDQIGAVAGPLLTALAIAARPGSAPLGAYRLAFGVLAVPAVATLVLVLAARRWFPAPEEFEPPPEPARVGLGPSFRLLVAAAALVGLGFADWALIAFHAGRSGLVALQRLPLLYAGAMALDGVAALAFGRAFDRRGPGVLALSCLVGAAAAPLVFLGGSAGRCSPGRRCGRWRWARRNPSTRRRWRGSSRPRSVAGPTASSSPASALRGSWGARRWGGSTSTPARAWWRWQWARSSPPRRCSWWLRGESLARLSGRRAPAPCSGSGRAGSRFRAASPPPRAGRARP